MVKCERSGGASSSRAFSGVMSGLDEISMKPPSTKQDAPDLLREEVCERQGDLSAPRVAGDDGPLKPQEVDKVTQVGRDGVEVVSVVGLVALAVSPLVEGHYPIGACKNRRDEVPDVRRRGEAVYQDDGKSRTPQSR